MCAIKTEEIRLFAFNYLYMEIYNMAAQQALKSQAQKDSENVTKFIRQETRRIKESGSREEAIKILKSAGIVDSHGKLTAQYR